MGTLTLTYVGSPSGSAVNLSVVGTISDADALSMLNWAQSTPSPFPSQTPPTNGQQVINAIGKFLFAYLISQVTNWKQGQAAVTAMAAVPPISIV